MKSYTQYLVCTVLALTIASPVFAKKHDVEHYFRKPEFSQMSLSPDGTHLAALAPVEGRMNLVVLPLESMKPTVITTIKKQDVSSFMWASNDRLLFFMDDDGNESFGIFAVNLDGSKGRTLVEPLKEQMSSGSFVLRLTNVIDRLKNDPTHVLVTNNKKRSAYPDVYKLNIMNGKMRMEEKNFGFVTGWGTDQHGSIRFATEQQELITRIHYKNPKTGAWELLIETNFGEPGFAVVGAAHDGKTLYMASTLRTNGSERNFSGLYEYDLETRKLGKMLFESDKVDVGGVWISDKKKKLIAATYYTDKGKFHFFDKKWESIYHGVQQAFASKQLEVAFTSITEAEDKAIVTAHSSIQPPIYYLLNAETGQLRELASSRNWIKAEEMAEMKPILLKSRDGLDLHGYLTLPPGSDGKNLPMVMHPHGGPWARDQWGFNNQIQFLASRGYAVLQVNFRGSTGYGTKFMKASFKQWGLKMQDDITDAVQWAINEGVADKDRICIFGASYGGYAAMAGLTFTPDLYKCGINYVGVTSIPLLFETMPKHWNAGRYTMEVMAGHPEKDKELLEDRSPINHVEKIKVPLLMAYGKRDPRVVLKHAKKLEKELKRYDKEYKLMVKKNEGHGFRKIENQIDLFTNVEDFLEANIGAL